MLIFVIYLISVIDAILGAAILGIFFTAASAILAIPVLDLDGKEEIASCLKKFIKPLVFLSLIVVFVPSKQTAYAMLAAYGLQEISQTEEAKRIGSKSVQVIEKALDEYLKEDKTE